LQISELSLQNKNGFVEEAANEGEFFCVSEFEENVSVCYCFMNNTSSETLQDRLCAGKLGGRGSLAPFASSRAFAIQSTPIGFF
jgi:hypothetical protein